MKLFKKVLAAALAGVLALSVLTGCNNSAATVTLVDALNDWSKFNGEGVTFEKGDEKLQSQVNELVEIVDEAGKDIKFGDAKDIYDIYNAFMKNDAAKLKLKAWAAKFDQAKIDDKASPLYKCGFADINATLSASSSKNIYYASQLLDECEPINPPAGDPNRWEEGDTSYVAVATGEVGGKKYMVALFKTTAVKNLDDHPSNNSMGEGAGED